MQQGQLNGMFLFFFFLKATLHFRLMVVNICSDGGEFKKKSRFVYLSCRGDAASSGGLAFVAVYRLTHAGDGQANRYFDFGRWFFSCRRRGGNGRGQ